jgi:DNA-binding transcriptional ArsR family regulator
MEEKITLDRESFRTLASKTRVGILKSLGRRRKMLTELSKQFGMSPSTIKEHMDQLSTAGLVIQIDDGHKWKYYELTQKGKEIVNPTGTRIFVVLGLSAIAILFTGFDLARIALNSASNFAAQSGRAGAELVMEAGDAAPAAAPNLITPTLPFIHIIGLGLFAAIFGISLGYIIARRMDNPSFLD